MHVLVLPSWYPIRERPQQGVYLKEQVQALRRRGVHVGVVYPEQRSLRLLSPSALARNRFQRRAYDEAGVPTLRRHGWNVLWRAPQRLPLRIREARRLAHVYARRFGVPDVLHAHSAQWAGAAAARLGAAWGRPYLLTEHFSGFQRGAVPRGQAALAREGFRRAHRVLPVSAALRTLLVASGWAEASRTEVLPNMVDTAFFTPPPARPHGVFRFFALAALRPAKDLGLLLRAFARAFGRGASARLAIGGGGPERRRLERLAERLGLGRHVRFLGRLNREEVRAELHRSHAFALSSRYETFGVVLIEAMATGLPVVATACGGPEDIVTPETGLLVPPGDAGALAEGLRTIRRRRADFRDSALRAYIEARFSTQAVTSRLLAHYAAARVST